ncbi:MAG: 5'-methylthioadenosine/adenosylhomocysteine nucleosidase, partial [Bacilli bacterium]|nr:5'-methylthioadenosine/adenosylhomocysteine nucleosidase [Bacilli bacterium]
TGDKFFGNNEEINVINDLYFSDYQAMAFDMESTALAQATYCYQIPFIAIRAISDVIGVENQNDAYYDYVEIACKKANEILYLLLEKL